MSETKEWIIELGSEFGAMPHDGLDKKSFMFFVSGHLKWLRDLEKDGYTDVVITRAVRTRTIKSPAHKILHLNKWIQCPTTLSRSISIDKLIELLQDPTYRNFPLESGDE